MFLPTYIIYIYQRDRKRESQSKVDIGRIVKYLLKNMIMEQEMREVEDL